MAEAQLVQEWLAKAGEDFAFAWVNLEEGKPFYAQICFHFHQAAEKTSRRTSSPTIWASENSTTSLCSSRSA
jgi:HEPN domain-containing protein